MYRKYRDSLFKIRYSYRGKKYRDVPVHRCIVAGLVVNLLLCLVVVNDGQYQSGKGYLYCTLTIIDGMPVIASVSTRPDWNSRVPSLGHWLAPSNSPSSLHVLIKMLRNKAKYTTVVSGNPCDRILRSPWFVGNQDEKAHGPLRT